MPQILFLIAAGAGLAFARRFYRHAQQRAEQDLRAARAAMARRDAAEKGRITPLERDPVTGIYRPKAADRA